MWTMSRRNCLFGLQQPWKTNSKINVQFAILPTPPDTWYKSYDVEMGYIRPPSIDETETESNDEENSKEVYFVKTNHSISIFYNDFCSIHCLYSWNYNKTIEGICTWNCDNEP